MGNPLHWSDGQNMRVLNYNFHTVTLCVSAYLLSRWCMYTQAHAHIYTDMLHYTSHIPCYLDMCCYFINIDYGHDIIIRILLWQ